MGGRASDAVLLDAVLLDFERTHVGNWGGSDTRIRGQGVVHKARVAVHVKGYENGPGGFVRSVDAGRRGRKAVWALGRGYEQGVQGVGIGKLGRVRRVFARFAHQHVFHAGVIDPMGFDL